MSSDTLTDEQLIELADAFGYEWEPNRMNIGDLSKDKAIVDLMKKSDYCVVNTTGMIFTCDPRSPEVELFRLLVDSKDFNSANKTISVCSADVIRRIHEGELETIESIENVLKDKETASEAHKELQNILQKGVELESSDIHMNLTPNGLYVSYRVSGHLLDSDDYTFILGRAITNIIYTRTGESIKNPSLKSIMNGAFNWQLAQHTWRFRVSWEPLVGGGTSTSSADMFGESTIRILKPNSVPSMKIEDLNFPPAAVSILRRVIKQKAGGLLIGGPTGSGKSATGHAVLDLVEPGKKISLLEDPVEAMNPRFRQTEVTPGDEELDMRAHLVNMLRQDTDVVLIGEIRDSETARTAAQVAMNGHFLVSTIHVDNALDIYNYLVRFLNLHPQQVASKSFGTIWMCQRLANKLCPHCSIAYNDETESLRKNMAVQAAEIGGYKLDKVRFRNVDGCDKCKEKGIPGFSGRIPVIELVEIDKFGRDCILSGDLPRWDEYLKESGWQSLADHARYLMSQGILDVEAATSEVGVLTQDHNHYAVKYKNWFSGGKGTLYREPETEVVGHLCN